MDLLTPDQLFGGSLATFGTPHLTIHSVLFIHYVNPDEEDGPFPTDATLIMTLFLLRQPPCDIDSVA